MVILSAVLASLFISSLSVQDAGCPQGAVAAIDAHLVMTVQSGEARQKATLSGLHLPGGAPRQLEQIRNFLLGKDGLISCKKVKRDRFGRASGLLHTAGATAQGYILQNGWAVVSESVPDGIDRAALLKAEDQARAAGLGLWADSDFFVRTAEEIVGMGSYDIRGRFWIIRGTLQNVSTSGAITYLNFGDNWRTDLTAELTGRAKRTFLKLFPDGSLDGAEIEMRGWLDIKNGPRMIIADPHLIRVIKDGAD